jgi:hypothetical protein
MATTLLSLTAGLVSSSTSVSCIKFDSRLRLTNTGAISVRGAAAGLYRPFGKEWFATAIADRCSFYLCLANGAMFYHQMIEGGSYEYSDYDESAKYFGHCTGLMAQRLGCKDDGVSEGVITTVLGFLCHDVRPWHLLLKICILKAELCTTGRCQEVGQMVNPYRWSPAHREAAPRLLWPWRSYSHTCVLVRREASLCNSLGPTHTNVFAGLNSPDVLYSTPHRGFQSRLDCLKHLS